jgi:predicted RecB family nuclease
LAATAENKRICSKGHVYYKSSDCPVCPKCEHQRKPKDEFLSILSGPARRALENNEVKTLKELSKYSETEILEFHGMGPASIPKLRQILSENGMSFRK